MLYAKGGVAWAGDKITQQTYPPLTNHRNQRYAARLDSWRRSESAFCEPLVLKVEYDFYNFNTRNLAFPGTIAGVPEVVLRD